MDIVRLSVRAKKDKGRVGVRVNLPGPHQHLTPHVILNQHDAKRLNTQAPKHINT